MRCVVGIDLGSTTTKALLLDEDGAIRGRGITNSRSNYEVACLVARQEALTAARFSMLEQAIGAMQGREAEPASALLPTLENAFRLELFFEELKALSSRVLELLEGPRGARFREALAPAAEVVLNDMADQAPDLFLKGERKSDFFRDLAGAMFMSEAERLGRERDIPFDRLVGLFDRAILDVETRTQAHPFGALLERALDRVAPGDASDGNGHDAGRDPRSIRDALEGLVSEAAGRPIEEVAFVGTGYGRQTLPFPKEAIRSEILCHGRGAHRIFPDTRTVLDIGGQDTKAIQVDDCGVVTSFQMNDRCAAGCGRYLGYIADELNLGLHELGPLALEAKRVIRVNSTCTVFAGAELRERLALGQRREDILAGLHRAILLRAMSLLARSGGISNEFSFTGGVAKNPMATKLLRGLVDESYGQDVALNIHPDSIYMGALGAALFARDDLHAGRPSLLPEYVPKARFTNVAHSPCQGCEEPCPI